MKIIAGHARGRVLKSPTRQTLVRPILARIKKSLFDILKPYIVNCNFLDLYAGTGSVGLEALSRGAARVTFVEQDSGCYRIIQQNAEALKFEDRMLLVRGSATGDLSSLPKPFDIIFMGPPYKDEKKVMLALTGPTILNVERHELLSPTGLLIAQHHKKEDVKAPSNHWNLFRQQRYGDSLLSFFKWQM